MPRSVVVDQAGGSRTRRARLDLERAIPLRHFLAELHFRTRFWRGGVLVLLVEGKVATVIIFHHRWRSDDYRHL